MAKAAIADKSVEEAQLEKPKSIAEKLDDLNKQKATLELQLYQTMGYIQALQDIVKENGH